jgi:hypothetical protein
MSWMALSLCAFLATLVIGIRYLRLHATLAICAALLITFPNNLIFITNIAHTQFFALYYLPCIVLLALWGIEDPWVTRWSLIPVWLAGVSYGLLFATEYYTAWLFSLTMLIALGSTAVICRSDLRAWATQYHKPAVPVIAAALVGFGIGLVPFAYIYTPTIGLLPGFSYRDYVGFGSFPKDIINVGTWNLMWGWLVERIIGTVNVERELAVTPALAIIFLVFLYRLRHDRDTADKRPWQVTFAMACVSAWAVSWIATVRIGTFSMYWLVYHVIPGASGIRVGGRVQLLANLWVSLGLCVLLQYWIDQGTSARRRQRIWLTGALMALCLLEQINLTPVSISRSYEQAWLRQVSAPPPECGAFLLSVTGRAINQVDDNDALWIALQTRVPTINGSSGWRPPDWHIEDRDIDYFAAARQWIAATAPDGQVCLYDRDARTWSDFH